MNSLILISPDRGWGFQPILSGKKHSPGLLALPQHSVQKTPGAIDRKIGDRQHQSAQSRDVSQSQAAEIISNPPQNPRFRLSRSNTRYTHTKPPIAG